MALVQASSNNAEARTREYSSTGEGLLMARA
jgi:hypothetical protein